MKIQLKKVKDDEVGLLVERCINDYENTHKLTVTLEELNKISDNIKIGSEIIIVNIEIEEYNAIIYSNDSQYIKKSLLSKKLYDDFKTTVNGTKIPYNIMLIKEMWAYLSLGYFKDSIMYLLFDEDFDKYYESRISRYYFSLGSKIDRTGFQFLWCIGEKLDGDYNLLKVAHEFIDPVKAVFERSMAKNSKVLKAFVEGIIVNNCDKRFKNTNYRKFIPYNFNSYAAITMLDAFDYDNLVKEIAKLQKCLLSI